MQAGSEGDSSLTKTYSAHAAIIDNTSFGSPDYVVYGRERESPKDISAVISS